ncbi:Pfs, NB-ARC and Ankyrin domain protein [Colletotrichum sp. SAR 10_86]|nr:Pfs, NB-ARC and Ankyrin domain protein [Colletotrichum sp. SAR 10_65]KAI8213609.1 Pfs, NB-ARC and Ankyrin domain protein [Colletotrichum sp. SAR 10_76]KAI8237327.1 Pfs, NB-ARC and Ankyrin domain protein [Colletotrichum sp. SAR 10_86]
MTYENYTVAIVSAIEFEMSAVRYMLDREHADLPTKEGDSNTYILGELQGHNVVLACLPGIQGKGAAATVATNVARSFPSIKWRFFVGIGGGVPSRKHDIRLGDVVVSMPEGQYGGVVQYDLGKETDDRTPREFQGPEIHYGLIASGDRVIKSTANRNEIIQNVGDVLCFEMEAAGLMTEFPCIVIRGISDYADSHKNDDWQHYAAATAAACTKELLGYVDSKIGSETAVFSAASPEQSNGLAGHHVFHGKGIQHTGSGNFSVGNDLNIS